MLVGVNNTLITIILAFSISFIGYLPARYIASYSFAKNILYNGLGLISAVFKWSFCVGLIGYNDLLKSSRLVQMRTYNSSYLLIPLALGIVILTILEVGKRLVKQLMK